MVHVKQKEQNKGQKGIPMAAGMIHYQQSP